jgi:meckelin
VERGPGGQVLAATTCAECGKGGYVLPTAPTVCQRCPSANMTYVNQACVCDSGFTAVAQREGLVCFADQTVQAFRSLYPDQLASTVTYGMVVSGSVGAAPTSQSVLSDTFARRFTSAALACQESQDAEACQTVGNLCVLALYDKSSLACKAFTELARRARAGVNNVAQWSAGLPWLYYSTDTTDTTGAVTMSVSFNPKDQSTSRSSTLRLTAATYSLDGAWLGFTKLTDSFQLCPPDPRQGENFMFFGYRYVQTCNYDLLGLLQGGMAAPSLEAAAGGRVQPYFYDLYLQDDGGVLVPVKVRLMDYKDGNVAVNANASPLDDQYVRRFVLFDNVGAKKDLNGKPSVVRVASKLTLKTYLNRARGQAIYPPVLEVTYTDRTAADVENYPRSALGSAAVTANLETVATPRLSFTVLYTMSVSGFLTIMLFLFITLMILIFLGAVFKLFFLLRRAQSAAIDFIFLGKMVLYLAELFARVFFWLLVGISFYWFIFFKWQDAVYVLLPEEASCRSFAALLVACFVASLMHILHVVFRQCRADIFLMDWEKSRGRLQGKGAEQGEAVSVTIWRTVLCANEFNEIQTYRHVALDFTLLAVLFFLSGLDLAAYSASQPNGRNDRTTHFVLRFAISSFFWLVIALGQVVWKHAVWYRYFDDPLNNFVDLLSVSNCSLLVLAERFWGFYLHGRSVHAHADVDLAEMRENLNREAESKVSRRGLITTDETSLQTYEVFLTSGVREEFDARYMSLVQEETAKRAAAQPRMAQAAASFRRAAAPNKAMPERMVEAYHSVNRFLCAFIGGIQSETGEAIILEKNFIHAAFGLPPDMSSMPNPLFYRDTRSSWTSVLFAGHEADFLIFNILTFAIVDHSLRGQPGSVFIAAIVTYLVQNAVDYLRSSYGETNLANKTMVDQRFLV